MTQILPTCLIFSTLEDAHVRAVLPKLGSDVVPLVIDFALHGSAYVLHAEIVEDQIAAVLVSKDGRHIPLDNVQTVWWRRPNPFIPGERLTSHHAKYVADERAHAWGAVLAGLPKTVAWYNHFAAQRVAEKKVYQVASAKSAGLNVPATIVTSSSAAAREFSSNHERVVFKSQWGHSGAWSPTRICTDDVLRTMAGSSECPVLFQEYITGESDYRVTIVDGFHSAVRFDLKESRYPIDVRIDTKTPCEEVTIPQNVVESLKKLMKTLGFRFGAIDLRQAKSGEFYFLELNPAGQFLYLDILAGTRNVDAMADSLSSTNRSAMVMNRTIDIQDISMDDHATADAPLAFGVEEVVHLY